MDSLNISINLNEDILRTLAGFLADALRERETRETRENRETRETKEKEEKVTKEEEKESVENKEIKESVENKEKENANTHTNTQTNTCNFLRVLEESNKNKNCVSDSVCVEGNSISIVPPTLKDIHDYIVSNSYNLSAEKFYKYYATNDWRARGGDSILGDWKRVVDSWAKKEYGKPNIKTGERYLAPTNFD